MATTWTKTMMNAEQIALKPRAQERRRRQVIDFTSDGVRDVVALGRYEYHSVQPGLGTHRHAGAIEICYLERGRQIYRSCGQTYVLTGGDVFVAAPGEDHDTADQLEDCGVLYWLILRIPEDSKRMLGLSARDSAALRDSLLQLPRRHFPGTHELKNQLSRLFDLYSAGREQLKTLRVRHQLLGCLFEILRCSSSLRSRSLSPGIDRVARKIRSCPEDNFSLSELAQEAGLSLSRLKAKFRSEIGIAPREYILRQKIEQAKLVLVCEERSVTSIAMSLGFSSSQYFATVFKRFTKMSPARFRQELRTDRRALSAGF